jgi:hypothetical protein
MDIDAEIAATEKELHGMSHGAVMYPILTQKLIALRLAKQQAVLDRTADPTTYVHNAVKHNWPDNFLGKVAIAVVGGFLLVCVLYVFRAQLGFPF